jgi:hypothetical protein
MKYGRSLLILALLGSRVAEAADDRWLVNTIPCESAGARPLLLQADGDAGPEWGILNGLELTVAEVSPGLPSKKYLLPPATALFDLRDTDRDGRAELAVVRAGRLEYWPDATLAVQADPAFVIEDAGLAAISYGAPKPYKLFVEDRGEDFVSVPLGAEPPMWTLEGMRVDTGPRSEAGPAVLSQINAWRSAPSPVAGAASQELHISQVFDISRAAPAAAPRRAGTRLARDAGDAPPEEWPWFPLGNGARVLYALAPPDYLDTLIRVQTNDTAEGPASASTARRFPGILIAPSGEGSDFDRDGYHDLLLWRAPRPGASLDSLVRAAQDGVWDVVLTVHLFNPATGRFAARPIEWIHTKAPVEFVLQGGVRGPFAFLRLGDLDGDGGADLVCTGAGQEISAWKFTGGPAARPWVSARFPELIEEIVLAARVPAYRWLGIARSARAFHLVALPQH